jgi:predicted ATPase
MCILQEYLEISDIESAGVDENGFRGEAGDMIRRIQVKNYRCLRYIDQPMDAFHVLVGPNASGKTTFLDVPAFLGDLLTMGLEDALRARSANFYDLLFNHQGNRFEIAIECVVPEDRKNKLPENVFDTVRYEVAVGLEEPSNDIHIFDEQVILTAAAEPPARQLAMFPMPQIGPETILTKVVVAPGKRVIRKVYNGNDTFRPEGGKGGKKRWEPSFRLGPKKSALANMPEDENAFPISTWLREMLVEGTRTLMLSSMALRQSSPPGRGFGFRPDGANLPWVIHNLEQKNPERKREWVAHLSTALPDLEDISTIEIPDTKHRYLRLRYRGGLDIPSWMASDGTLRMLALTLPAYLPEFEGIYLIEEPENGVHPQAMETVYQSLSSVYSAQILIATHSPVILGCASARDILCFKKNEEGASDIVRGDLHPALVDWQGGIELSVLYASGVLG